MTTGPPRRRSPLDHIPANIEPRFKVLGTGVDRQALQTYATPMEMLVVHGFTREIDESFARYSGRLEEFWNNNPDALQLARKLDDVLATVVSRRSAA